MIERIFKTIFLILCFYCAITLTKVEDGRFGTIIISENSNEDPTCEVHKGINFCDDDTKCTSGCDYQCTMNDDGTCSCLTCFGQYASSSVCYQNTTCLITNAYYSNGSNYIIMVAVLCIASFMVFGCLLCLMAARQNRYLNDSRSFFRSGLNYRNRTRPATEVSRVNTRSVAYDGYDDISIIPDPPLPKYEDIASYPSVENVTTANPLQNSEIPPPAYEDVHPSISNNRRLSDANVNSNIATTPTTNSENFTEISFVNESFSV